MSALQQRQYELFDAEELSYHDTARPGFFSILHSQQDTKRQRSYRLDQLPTVIQLLDKTRDTWISQAEFTKPNRRIVNLWRVGLCFADLDTYAVGWGYDTPPERLVAALLYHCGQEGIPAPSLVVFSGRGLQAKWLLESAIPRQALPRWNLCQRVLVDRLAMLGADAQAKDASRVLRLVGAVNTKSGEIARVVHVTEGADGQPVRYGFDHLCEWLLPIAREQIERERKARNEARAARRQQLVALPGGGQINGLRGFSGRQLAWHRLEDLRKLADMRGGVGEGERMLHLFWQLNFLLLSGATNSVQMWHEAQALARAIDPAWHHDKSALSTLYAKAKAYEAGERIELNGRSYAPLYTPKNDSLINTFRITDDEQRELQTIITPGIARERHAEREKARREAHRLATGGIDRVTYESASVSRLKPWEQLGMSRRTWYRKGCPESVDNRSYPQVDNVG